MLLHILVADFTDMEDTKNTSGKKPAAGEVFTESKSEKPLREKKAAPRKPKEKADYTDTEEPNFLTDGRLSKIAGLSLVLFAFMLLIAFSSYLFTLAEDQSELLNQGASAVGSTEIKNALGSLGAFLANLFINNLFGLSSYLFVPLLGAIGFNLLVQKSVFSILKLTIYSFFSLIWISATMAFANSLIQPESILQWGGAFGNYLTGTSGYLTNLIQVTGVAALLTVTALIFAVILYNINFGFLLSMFSKTEVPPAIPTTMAEPLSTDVSAYKDTDENIFAKDNLAEAVIQTPPPAFKLDLPEEETEEPAMELLRKEEPESIPLDTDLELEVAEVVEETTATENPGRLGTTFDPTLNLSNYQFPTLDLLEEHGSDKVKIDAEELERNKNQIISTLNNYQIEISKIKATIGPTVTLYEIVPAPGVRISKIKNLEDDIALSLAALGIRIIAPIPGKGTIGIEVPNAHKEVVSMRSLLASEKFQNTGAELPICLGKSISNEIFVGDLAKMPHLLMAGATGQGKSVGINSILVSLLYKKHPSQLKFVLVDPKKVELSLYETLEKHFLAKLPGEEDAIITDTKKVVTTLNALCLEMDDRYNLLKKASCRNLKEYNHKFLNRQLNPQNGHKFLPYIVLVVDEFADLIMTAGKEVEMPIARLAQLARAIGIHLILATQRPSVNIITGTIKANFPARIAFKTTSKIDSRTILDQGGSEQLIGRGDMLLSMGSDMIRLQCGFVDTPEVEKVRDFISNQQGYATAFELPEYVDPKDKENGGDDFFIEGERDDLFEDAARVIVQNQMGSTSLIQRRLKLGYNRAGRLMDQLQEAGVVGDNLGTKSREVKFKTELELEQYLQKLREKTH